MMVDKVFYQRAAEEVESGNLDRALWIKVSTDMAGAAPIVRQAKYIQLRAHELATEDAVSRAKAIVPIIKIKIKRTLIFLTIGVIIIAILSSVYWHYDLINSDYYNIIPAATEYKATKRDYNEVKLELDHMLTLRSEQGAYNLVKRETTDDDRIKYLRSVISKDQTDMVLEREFLHSSCPELASQRKTIVGGIVYSFIQNRQGDQICLHYKYR